MLIRTLGLEGLAWRAGARTGRTRLDDERGHEVTSHDKVYYQSSTTTGHPSHNIVVRSRPEHATKSVAQAWTSKSGESAGSSEQHGLQNNCLRLDFFWLELAVVRNLAE